LPPFNHLHKLDSVDDAVKFKMEHIWPFENSRFCSACLGCWRSDQAVVRSATDSCVCKEMKTTGCRATAYQSIALSILPYLWPESFHVFVPH